MSKKNAKKTKVACRPNSYFDGGLLGLIGITAAQFFVTLITLTFGAYWAVCYGLRWHARHTVVNGRRLRFDGTAWQLFGNCLKWFFLTIITLTIYGWWVPIKYRQWVAKHTVFDEAAESVGCQNNACCAAMGAPMMAPGYYYPPYGAYGCNGKAYPYYGYGAYCQQFVYPNNGYNYNCAALPLSEQEFDD